MHVLFKYKIYCGVLIYTVIGKETLNNTYPTFLSVHCLLDYSLCIKDEKTL